MTLAHVRRGAGPPLLLLHGLGGSIRFWDPLWPHLAGRDVLAVDLLGHGRSPAPRTAYTLHDHLEALYRVLEHQRFPPCTVLGHSLGGVLAASLAALRPQQVTGLLLVNAPMPVDFATNLAEARAAAGIKVLTVGEPVSRAAVSLYRQRLFRKHLFAGFPDEVVDDFERAPWFVLHRTLWNAVIRQDLRPLASRILQPVTAVLSGRDRVVMAHSTERYLHYPAGSVRRVRVEGADHVLPWTHPELVAAELDSTQLYA